MTRIKKSRKEGILIAKPAKKDKKDQLVADKKPRKKTGNKAGSRQAVQQTKNDVNTTKKAKDPRIGSKKPIDLTPKAPEKKPAQQNQGTRKSGVAPVRVVEAVATLSIAEQIAAIESDPRLLDMLDKMDADIALTEEEVYLYNDLMEQHEALTEQLPPEELPADETNEDVNEQDDDELWDKFDREDFSDF